MPQRRVIYASRLWYTYRGTSPSEQVKYIKTARAQKQIALSKSPLHLAPEQDQQRLDQH